MSHITFEEGDDGVTRFSCGCSAKVVDELYILIPCSPDCKVYRYSMEESERLKNPMVEIVSTEKPQF